jgi:Streptomyces sporulation and cell division protein, SsgA
VSVLATPVVFLDPCLDQVAGEWRYDPGDPLAVTLLLHGETGSVDWVFARSLLADALGGHPDGRGEVVMYRSGSRLVVGLRSPEGERWMSCDAGVAEAFHLRCEAALGECRLPGHAALCRGPWVGGHPVCRECRTVGAALDRWLASAGLSGEVAA